MVLRAVWPNFSNNNKDKLLMFVLCLQTHFNYFTEAALGRSTFDLNIAGLIPAMC